MLQNFKLTKPIIKRVRSAKYLFIYIKFMSQKSVEKVGYSKNIIKQSLVSFNELSISSIKEKGGCDSSFDFSQQKQMLNQINGGLAETNDQYGLHKPIATRCFAKKQKLDHHIQLIRGTSLSRLHNFQNSQNLCFNKDIKRKKISSKSKQKLSEPSSLLTTCYSLKQLKSTKNVQFQNRKIRQPDRSTTQISQKPYVDVKKIFKAPRIALKIYEDPLCNSSINDQQKTFIKFYHHLPDDYKIQLNDLSNWHKEFDLILKNQHETLRISEEIHSRIGNRKQAKSFIAIDLKRSRLSKPEDKNCTNESETSINPTKKSEIYAIHGAKQVVEVSKPMSVSCKNSSFYSSRTEDYESPISKDSGSTATRRIIKRSEFCKTPEEYGYGYFQVPSRTKHMKR